MMLRQRSRNRKTSHYMTPDQKKHVIYIDVDDTLIRTFGSKQIPMPLSIEYVRRMSGAGHELFCWSRGGGEYARKIAISLGIDDCFTAFLPKPSVVFDDRGEKLLDHCEFVLPGNVSSY